MVLHAQKEFSRLDRRYNNLYTPPSPTATAAERNLTVPSGKPAASWSGIACMPLDGTTVSPEANMRKTNSSFLLKNN